MENKVRVRFAPSPTGPLHIGGVRTALFNYLFAKKHNGTFILRIEDTDQKRFVENAEQYIIDSLKWCGIEIDEGPGTTSKYGPYKQSERKSIYQDYALQLVNEGKAYYAFDTPQSLDEHRAKHEAEGKTFIYNWHNREKLDSSLGLTQDEIDAKLSNNIPFVIRFKTPVNQTLKLQDIIRGNISIDTNTLDDKVLYKSDGMPTYHLANIVDDHLMEISHVIRGEEWLPSLPLHQLLYTAFNWEAPKFAHLPLILKPVGKGKLSKRDGEKLGFPVFPLTWENSKGYKEEGYFSETVVNFLAMLGWNPGTEQEFFTIDELCKAFTLDRVNKSGARFDPEKTKWYNQHYLQQKSNSELADLYLPLLAQNGITPNKDYVTQVIGLIKERAIFVSDFWELSNYFFESPKTYNEKASRKQWKENTANLMQDLSVQLEPITDFSSANTETIIKQWIAEKNLSFGQIMPPLRLILVGDMKGPHIFDIIGLIGKDETISRIKSAIEKLEK